MAKKLQIVGDLPAGTAPDKEEVQQMVDEYLAENPLSQQFTINGEGPDENGNFVINITSEESSNMVEF